MLKQFSVQGSSAVPYTVTFTLAGGQLTATCDCDAGRNGMACKHRIRLLNGLIQDVVSGSEKDISEVVRALQGTHLDAALAEVEACETAAAVATKKLAAAKKRLAIVMRGSV